MPRLLNLLVLAACLACAAGPAPAAPVDAQVGQTRATYNRQGTALRQTPGSLGAVAATLPAGTTVRVLEVRLPWLRVQAAQGTGWVLALDTIEPAALGSNAPPPASAGAGGVSGRDVSAAGRQFDAKVERGYRGRYPNVDAAYPLVDALERATEAMVPADAVAFIVEGRLGRRGRAWSRPGRVPASPRPQAREGRKDKVRKRIGGALGGLLRDAGVDGDIADAVQTGVSEFGAYAEEMKKRFTPDQEYYLGRAVAATAIARYGIDPDPVRRGYVRLVGECLVRLSDRVPANYGGYHFDVLDSDEVNAISGPGGFVLITRGAVLACRTEDELAGVLAHELAHITRKHGEATIRESKSFQSGLQAFGRTAAAGFGLDDDRALGPLVDMFDKAAGEMARTAMEAQYGRPLELEADTEGTYLLADVMYDPSALQQLLARNQGTHGATHTHDAPAVRAGRLGGPLGQLGAFQPSPEAVERRAARFAQWMGRAPSAAPPR